MGTGILWTAPHWDLPSVVLMIRLGLWVWRRRAYRAFSSCHVKRDCHHDLAWWTLAWVTWPRRCWSGFPPTELPRPPFLYRPLWKDITTGSPDVRNGELCSTSLKMECFHKLFGFLLQGRIVSPPLFIYLIIYLCQYGLRYLFYTLGYNPAQIIPLCPLGVPSVNLHVTLSHLSWMGDFLLLLFCFVLF